MTDISSYWKDLASTVLRYLQEQDNIQTASVIKNSELSVECTYHDSLNGGTDYWDLFFCLKYRDYVGIASKKAEIEKDILSLLKQFHIDERNCITSVTIKPIIERFINWKAILPTTKEDTIRLIQKEQKMLTDIATRKLSYVEDGVEASYQEEHQKILEIAHKTGFDYPVTTDSLAEWWTVVKRFSSYAERRSYISSVFTPLINKLRESDINSIPVTFQPIATMSGVVQKAVEDAEVFIREERFDSAVDRVHTAFYGYLRQLLTTHEVTYEANDKLPSLYTKLYIYYETIIQPEDVGKRIKTILRSAGGMIETVNELRNNNTIAHPNKSLIHAREAELVLHLVNDIMCYLEGIEMSLNTPER